jgi:hypothetical protein
MSVPSRAFVTAVVLLAGSCATPEYQLAQGQCEAEAIAAYPVVQQPQIFRRSRQVKVPDGSTICETQTVQSQEKHTEISTVRTVCRPGMKSAREYYDETIMVDVNRDSREAHVNQCARTLCLQRYGNMKCKV